MKMWKLICWYLHLNRKLGISTVKNPEPKSTHNLTQLLLKPFNRIDIRLTLNGRFNFTAWLKTARYKGWFLISDVISHGMVYLNWHANKGRLRNSENRAKSVTGGYSGSSSIVFMLFKLKCASPEIHNVALQ